MDTTDPDIRFDSDGICNHCYRYDELLPQRVFEGKIAKQKLKDLVANIKSNGSKNDYDCLIGVSGGVDSTYVAYLTKKLGLKPLAVHFDNGWNSELAVNNIRKMLDRLDIDLYTYVVNNKEVDEKLPAITCASRNSENLIPLIVEAAQSYATLGEIVDSMKVVFGEWQEAAVI